MADEKNVQTPQEEQQSAPAFDYDKLASILDGKIAVTEKKVLGGYFKEQGLSEDEMAEAIEAFKKDRASKAPDVDALNQKITDLDDKFHEADSRALFAEAQYEAVMLASELGVGAKTVPYLMRMADLSDVVTDGQIDQEKLKSSLSKVLDDLPQLKETHEERTGFKIGSDGGHNKGATNEELARIFGVKMK